MYDMQVMIWDDHQGRCIGELTFRNQVRALRNTINLQHIPIAEQAFVCGDCNQIQLPCPLIGS